jgi:hypothetical protein
MFSDFHHADYNKMLNMLNQLLYFTFGFVLTIWGMVNAGKLASALNRMSEFVREGNF